MSFYLSTKGVLHPYEFRYLKGDFEKARLEATLVPGMNSTVQSNQKDFYAIDIMAHPVKVLSKEANLETVRSLMKREGIRHIPITDDHAFLGMISDRDLLKLDMSSTFSFLKAEEVMNTLVVVATEETPLAHIARVLLEEKISAIPILNAKFHLVGMISRSDILKVVIYNRLVLK